MKRPRKQQPPQGYAKIYLSPHDLAELDVAQKRWGDFEPSVKHWAKMDAILDGILFNCSDKQLIQLGACVVQEALQRGVDSEMLARGYDGYCRTRSKRISTKGLRRRGRRETKRRLIEEAETETLR